jgi:copper chaperone CopZ
MSYYLHDVPGRLRIKTPFIKGNENLAKHVKRFLEQINGITSITTNPLTGSIIMTYDEKKLTSKMLLDTLKTRGIFDSAKAVTNDQYIHSNASKASQIVYKAVVGAFVEKAFEGSALSLLTVLL